MRVSTSPTRIGTAPSSGTRRPDVPSGPSVAASAGRGRLAVDVRQQLLNRRAAPRDLSEQRLDEGFGDAHPPLEREIAVRLGEHADPVSQADAVGDEPRTRVERAPRRRAAAGARRPILLAIELPFRA